MHIAIQAYKVNQTTCLHRFDHQLAKFTDMYPPNISSDQDGAIPDAHSPVQQAASRAEYSASVPSTVKPLRLSLPPFAWVLHSYMCGFCLRDATQTTLARFIQAMTFIFVGTPLLLPLSCLIYPTTIYLPSFTSRLASQRPLRIQWPYYLPPAGQHSANSHSPPHHP